MSGLLWFRPALCATVLFLCASIVWAATITTNPQQQYQTIEGFGAHGSKDVWWSGGPFFGDGFIDRLLDDLGMTVFRNEFYPDEGTNATGYGTGQWNKQLPFLREVKRKGDEKGIDVKFLVSLWSPPGGFKYNNVANGEDALWNRVSNGIGPLTDYQRRDIPPLGSAKPDHYDDVANYCVNVVKRYVSDVGTEPYAFSFQNEPEFAQSFNSCVYSAGQYRDMLTKVGKRFRQEGFATKIFGPETMLAGGNLYIRTSLQDPEARQYLDALAYHGYSDGVLPTPSSTMSAMWGAVARLGENLGIPVWMTETSGYDDTWAASFDLASAIYSSLHYGNLSMWVWWQISGAGHGPHSMMTQGQPGIRYQASKHFYRYLRPGTVRIAAVSDDENVLVVGFNDPNARQFVSVLINYSEDQKTVSFTGSDVPDQLRMYLSTPASPTCADQGNRSKTAITLPGRSLATLVGDNYAPSVGVSHGIRRADGGVAAAPGTYSVRMHALDGTLVRTLAAVEVGATGRFSWDRRSDTGAQVAAGAYRSVLVGAKGAMVPGPTFIH